MDLRPVVTATNHNNESGGTGVQTLCAVMNDPRETLFHVF